MRRCASTAKLRESIRSGAAEIAQGKKGGWTADKASEATDIVTGMLRHLQAELADDPLVEDPDLASVTRQALSRIDSLLGPTSLEVATDGLGKDLRKAWSTAKATELKALKKEGIDTAALSKAFDGGLGPILDSWSAELAKFPKQDRAKLKSATVDAARVLAQYRLFKHPGEFLQFDDVARLHVDVELAAIERISPVLRGHIRNEEFHARTLI